MPLPNLVWRGALLAVALTQSPAASANAHPRQDRPQVTKLACVSTSEARCTTGDALRVEGEGLQSVKSIVFLGGRGRADDRRVRPRSRDVHAVTVIVPPDARSGPVRATATSGSNSLAKPVVTIVTSRTLGAPPGGDTSGAVFPVGGEHTYGTAANRFGGARGHQGQDVFAACGTPVVAAVSGTVEKATFDSRAGNYAVIGVDDGTNHVYMHMHAQATVTEGQQVTAGQPIGAVGETGRASGCHLHFELWTAPGWYAGGRAVDPLSWLRSWDSQPTGR